MSAAAPLRALPLPPRASRAGDRPNARAGSASVPATRPRLAVVAAPTAGRVPFVLAVAGVLAVGLVTLLLLHTMAAQDAFTVHALQHQASTLADQEQALALANEQAQAPTDLATRAHALGMVPATSLAVTRLHGRPVALLGAPKLAPLAPVATPAATTTAAAITKPATTTTKPAATAKPTATTKPAATAKPRPRPTATPTHR